MTAQRAVVTGIGVVAPSGTGIDEHWETVCAGTNRLRRISLFDPTGYPTTIAGEVRDFDVSDRVDGRLLVQTDRWTWMGFVAAEQALRDAGIAHEALDPYTMSVVLASSSGGNWFGQSELQRLWNGPSRTVSAYQSIAWFYAATVGQLSIKHQAKGPSNVLVSESAGGLDSLQHAARLVRRGTPVVLAGGLEAPLSPYALSCQLSNGRLSGATDPARAYRPFDVEASGYVPGEGGAVFVVEDLDHALARETPMVYGEIAGWGNTHDGFRTSSSGHDASRQYARALRQSMRRAEVSPDEVSVVIPDAVGVAHQDRAEGRAIRAVFGSRDVAVTTNKSLTGRMYQGGSAVDVATALRALREQTLPLSTGTDEPADECDLGFVRRTRSAVVDTALIGARGFNGFNSSLLLRRYTSSDTRTGGLR